MPRGDGTGPMGNGRPGRGLGPCQNIYKNTQENQANQKDTTEDLSQKGVFQRGMGRGMGNGQGMGQCGRLRRNQNSK